MVNTTKAIQSLEENGFVMFPNFIPQDTVAQARQELEDWYAKDLEKRQENNISDPHYNGVAGRTVLTKPSHLMIDVYGKAPTLDNIVNTILNDPTTSKVLKELVGDNFDFYGYNIRLMTGTYDPGPAHEWHRDSPGEFGIGILLTDTPPEHAAATALVPGSHMFPYCPRHNTLFKDSCRDYYRLNPIVRKIINLLPANRLLQNKIRKIATGASGKQGDIYFFINDVWHGRQPNLHGNSTMVMLVGGAPSEFKLHHEVIMPPKKFLEGLPESIKNAFCNREKPINTGENSIIHRMLKNREPLKFTSIFYWARFERKLFDLCKKILKFIFPF